MKPLKGMRMSRKVIYTDSADMTSTIFGTFDSNTTKVEQKFEVRIYNKKIREYRRRRHYYRGSSR